MSEHTIPPVGRHSAVITEVAYHGPSKSREAMYLLRINADLEISNDGQHTAVCYIFCSSSTLRAILFAREAFIGKRVQVDVKHTLNDDGIQRYYTNIIWPRA